MPFDLQSALSHWFSTPENPRLGGPPKCHNCAAPKPASPSLTQAIFDPNSQQGYSRLATEQELSDFLKSVERRAFKRSVYHVRNDEAALDIVQDSMMKLAEHYGHKPVEELPMLFHRILSNCTLDWFRRQKTHNALFSNMGDFESSQEDGDFDLLETLHASSAPEQNESTETQTERAQTLLSIEEEILQLPTRQREAFLMRYWEDMDVAETAAAMGCSQGSVKTHCSRAVHALGAALKAKGIRL
ncbi:RNA polymerase sigma-70 factor (ECF subfamily) [Rhodoferax saidenbachensis]|uniref:RNA polymerase sigma-70 factor (ECF subfamily) n=1 Tax=Rhodoferax saidenbachensis TaxID=1484693 RepID=A0ABU1ZU73_9BURK|nr:RNA polymerase sigma-70 factor (ECF subfamily) [Rhodoferax saidenbachensis]